MAKCFSEYATELRAWIACEISKLPRFLRYLNNGRIAQQTWYVITSKVGILFTQTHQRPSNIVQLWTIYWQREHYWMRIKWMPEFRCAYRCIADPFSFLFIKVNQGCTGDSRSPHCERRLLPVHRKWTENGTRLHRKCTFRESRWRCQFTGQYVACAIDDSSRSGPIIKGDIGRDK